MGTMVRGCFAMLLAALLVWPAMALAATHLEKFSKAVLKHTASDFDPTPPVVCVCQDPGLTGWAGVLVSGQSPENGSTQVFVNCAIRAFAPDTGEIRPFNGGFCFTFVVLPK